MNIENIILEIEENGSIVINDMYNIHTAKPVRNVKKYAFYFKKIHEHNSDNYELDDLYEQLSDYVATISYEEIREQPNIEFYLDRFKNANKRHITGDASKAPVYTEYASDEIINIKTIIKSFPNKYADVAFKIYINELRSHNLRKFYGVKKEVKTNNKEERIRIKKYNTFDINQNKITTESIEPLDKDMFDGLKIYRGYQPREKELFLSNYKLKMKYISKVRDALNIRKFPNGTSYTDIVITNTVRIAGTMNMAKKQRTNRLTGLLTNKKYDNNNDMLLYRKDTIDRIV